MIDKGRRQGLFEYDTDQWGDTWNRRRHHRLAVELYGALCAVEARGETPVSLATCEKVSESAAVPDFSEGGLSGATEVLPEILAHIDDVDEAAEIAAIGATAWEAIRCARGKRLETVIALLSAGEVAHALRFATCGQRSVQLQCADEFGAGGCGSKDNFVPITCDSRLCPECMDRKMGKVSGQYSPVVESWDHPTMIRLSLPRRFDPDELELAIDSLRGAHSRLRKRVIPADGPEWSWSEWKRALQRVGATETARRWQKRYVGQEKGIPVKEALRTGFYGIDVKQGPDMTLNVHMHVLADVPWVPQEALSAVWGDLTDAPVVDIRRIHGGAEAGLMEVVGYAAKPPEYVAVEDEIEYFKTLKGTKLIQPFGDLHGNTPDCPARLLCADCGESPRWWTYLGIVDEAYDTVEVDTGGGDRPPPDQ